MARTGSKASGTRRLAVVPDSGSTMSLREPASTAAQSRRARKQAVAQLPPLPSFALPRALRQADAELADAAGANDPAEQFRHAHLAALRSAAAVVEFRGRPNPRLGARTVWEMLTIVEPDLTPWSVYFASGASLRAEIENGYGDKIDEVRAAEIIACAEDFRDEVALVLEADVDFPRPQLSLVRALAS